MPLNAKGKKIMRAVQKEYGPQKGKRVFYAMENGGKIKGVVRRGSRRVKKARR